MTPTPAVAIRDITVPAVLERDVIYVLGTEFVCGNTKCAGMTAVYTGVGIGGQPARSVTPHDVEEWATYGLGPLVCTCGQRRATPVSDGHGRALTRLAADAD